MAFRADQAVTAQRGVCVVIPCYRVRSQILGVLAQVPEMVEKIYVVDDCCPEGSGALVQSECRDPRVKILFHAINQGVGGAVLSGYRAAMADGMQIAVKVDGDGQMDPALVPAFVEPIVNGFADYTKGTRFFSFDMVRAMPKVRLFGNSALSLINKAVSGYWSVMDPTNGYTAIHLSVPRFMPLDRIEKRYFFESDMLYHLGILRAVVQDVPMHARYADEQSNLHIGKTLLSFPTRYLSRMVKRFLYNYLLRDFNAGSLATLAGVPMVTFGVLFGAWTWIHNVISGVPTPAGTIMVAALPIIVGMQFIVAATLYDISNQPKTPLHKGGLFRAHLAREVSHDTTPTS